MIYVGKTSGSYNQYDGCVIDPNLPLGVAAAAEPLGYWPSYQNISPNCRKKYLEWLGSGKQAADIDIGYVFLYFYGLELRLIAETPSAIEVEALSRELQRLRSLYSGNGSFNGYSARLLEAISFLHDAKSHNSDVFVPDLAVAGAEMSPALKLAIAREVMSGRPLEFELAAAALIGMHDFWANHRQVLEHARQPFLLVLRTRFADAFPSGFLVRNRKDSQLAVTYRGATAGLYVDLTVQAGLKGLPDPETLTWTKLLTLAEGVANELAPLAKLLAYYPTRANSLTALVNCPAELRDSIAVDARGWIDGLTSPAPVPFGLLAKHAIGAEGAKWTVRHRRQIGEALAGVGWSMEPGADDAIERLADDTVVFVIREVTDGQSREMTVASAAAMLVANIAKANKNHGTKLEEFWLSQLPSRLALPASHTERLRARLAWYRNSNVAIPKVKRLLGDATSEERELCAWSAIATARIGRYPKTLIEGLDDARRERFFSHSHGSYGVAREIRDLCTFSVHNLVRDPPFSQMSLVSCRNLLIYLNADLQARIIPVFHYALVPGGILLLGGSESVAQHSGLFETVDKKARIFRRRQGRSPELNLRWQHPRSTSLGPSYDGGHPMSAVQSLARREASAAGGRAADEAGSAARYDRLLGPVTPTPEIVVELQRALAETGAEHQLLAEEHQTALEELRSANEELHSVNEELQSTNEELETSKEELQSVNEELHTVNIRLTEKIEELDQANGDLRNLFESTEIATVFLDRHLVIRSFTPAIATLYNLIPSDQGRPLTDIVSRLEYDSLREDVTFVLAKLEPLERRIVRDDRSVHYVMRILPYREPDSTVTGVLITFIDVTSIVRAEEALVAADVRKDVFLATLSHELRNPLAPIRIAARLLQAPDLDPEELRHAQDIIARQVGHMSSLLDDLLDVSRITRGAFLLKKAYVDLQVLMDEAIEAVQAAIDAKQHTLRVERPAEPILLEVDPVRLTQVITNLLTNAVKYTPSGGVIQMGTRFEAQHLAVFVRDSGIGLSTEAMGRVFDMFTRIEPEANPSEGGLGIGLSLAKGLIELHGGHIEVRSAGRGQGSEFVICLPRSLIVDASTHGPARPNAVAGPPAPRRILVADDNRDSADTMGMLLQLSGHEVHVAHSGAEALETAKRVRPDVGIFDIGMPDLNGYELAERIRHEAWGAGMTLIAVTGWGQDTDRRRALAAGFDHHLTKPIEPDQLEHLFNGAAPHGA